MDSTRSCRNVLCFGNAKCIANVFADSPFRKFEGQQSSSSYTVFSKLVIIQTVGRVTSMVGVEKVSFRSEFIKYLERKRKIGHSRPTLNLLNSVLKVS